MSEMLLVMFVGLLQELMSPRSWLITWLKLPGNAFFQHFKLIFISLIASYWVLELFKKITVPRLQLCSNSRFVSKNHLIKSISERWPLQFYGWIFLCSLNNNVSFFQYSHYSFNLRSRTKLQESCFCEYLSPLKSLCLFLYPLFHASFFWPVYVLAESE